MMAPVIDVVGVSKRYGPVLAVDAISLRVAPGEIYALLGLNGAGKSTLIRMLLGLSRPSAGAVRLWDEPVTPDRRRLWSRVGYLVDASAAYPELTVRENLEVVRRLRRLSDRAAVPRVVERLGLAPYAERRARTLSQGNTQRLGLAKALLHEPALLILDEPANSLDPAGVVEVRDLLLDLAHHGTTILLSSHVLAEVSRLAIRIGVLHQGRLVRELTPAELGHRLSLSTRDNVRAGAVLEAAGWRPSRVGDALVLTDAAAIAAPERVATALVQGGCPPTRLVVEADDLETTFLDLVTPEGRLHA
jgi:ABC-2 type transport system ATP-binding protein